MSQAVFFEKYDLFSLKNTKIPEYHIQKNRLKKATLSGLAKVGFFVPDL